MRATKRNGRPAERATDGLRAKIEMAGTARLVNNLPTGRIEAGIGSS
jgi:hypothetical protein